MIALVTRYAQIGIDIVGVGGDFAGNRPLISPEAYRRFIVPEVRAVAEAVHAEGMLASELKHGTLALIEKGTPVVVIAPNGQGYNDTISSAQELAARGAEIIGVAQKPHPVFKHTIKIPASNGTIAPILEVIPLQLLAYSMATERKNDPDHPRNLAKSVTVK
jgi:glucosamine--fructose-6-phosphate aminotransferase (isomerizing)